MLTNVLGLGFETKDLYESILLFIERSLAFLGILSTNPNRG